MDSLVNIDSSISDEFYRYKMPRIIVKIEGSRKTWRHIGRRPYIGLHRRSRNLRFLEDEVRCKAYGRYVSEFDQFLCIGRGNGIKTLVVNMTKIAKALNRIPAYPIKFFGTELGTQSKIDHKNDKYMINGVHDALTLQELLNKFIKKYVLCTKCGNPETNMRVSRKSGLVTAECIACGWVWNLDNNHKVAKFIRKNPPTNQDSIINDKGKSTIW